MLLLDTNIFLELLLGQKKARECEKLLASISDGKTEAVVTHFTAHAVEAALGRGEPLTKFLRNLEFSVGMYVYDTSLEEEMSIGILASEIKRDFDDTLQYYVAKKLGASGIVSFDKHFDGLDIPRLEPAKIVAAG